MIDPAIDPKTALRRAALARRDALAPDVRTARSAAIVARLQPLMSAQGPACVALYLPIRSEVDLTALVAPLRVAGTTIALPALSGGGIVFRLWREGDALATAVWGIREPSRGAAGATPDLILLPMAGFDRTGHRLGYGKGHYDRAIAALRNAGYAPRLIGVAFAAQEVAPIPATPYDVPLDLVVTEDEVLRF